MRPWDPVVADVNITRASLDGASASLPVCLTSTSRPCPRSGTSVVAALVTVVRRVTSASGTRTPADTTAHPTDHAAWIATTEAALLSSRMTTRVPGISCSDVLAAAFAS